MSPPIGRVGVGKRGVSLVASNGGSRAARMRGRAIRSRVGRGAADMARKRRAISLTTTAYTTPLRTVREGGVEQKERFRRCR